MDSQVCDSQPSADHGWYFSDLRALFITCTLKRSPGISHARGLMDIAIGVMETNGVRAEKLRAVDCTIAPGVHPDVGGSG